MLLTIHGPSCLSATSPPAADGDLHSPPGAAVSLHDRQRLRADRCERLLRLDVLGLSYGVELSESTSSDAFTPTSCWLLVLDVDEEWIAPYEEWRPSSRLLRSALARLNLGPRGREWLVPAKVLNEHARVIDVGDFSNVASSSAYEVLGPGQEQ
jgi:hypothetical protein